MNNRQILLGALGLIVILTGLILLNNGISNNIETAGYIEILSEDQLCFIDKDCIIVSTKCSSCECGVPINKNNEFKYKEKFIEICKNYHGGVCDYCCPTPYIKCINNECTLTNLSKDGIESNPCG